MIDRTDRCTGWARQALGSTAARTYIRVMRAFTLFFNVGFAAGVFLALFLMLGFVSSQDVLCSSWLKNLLQFGRGDAKDRAAESGRFEVPLWASQQARALRNTRGILRTWAVRRTVPTNLCTNKKLCSAAGLGLSPYRRTLPQRVQISRRWFENFRFNASRRRASCPA